MERNDSFLCFCLFQRPSSSDSFGHAFFSSERYFRLGGVYSGCVALASLLPPGGNHFCWVQKVPCAPLRFLLET